MNRYVIFLDIDGTVYCGGAISAGNREAIRLAQNAGHKVCINTARSPADIPDKIRNVHWDAIVSSIGSHIVVDGRTLLAARIPAEDAARVFDELTAAGIGAMIEGDTTLLCNPLFDNGHCTVLRSGDELLRRFPDEAIAKMFLPGVLPQHLQDSLAARYQFYQHQTYAEFSVKGHTKATGMLPVLRAFGTDIAHCIAMGDSVNDLEMLRAAGISVAMGDADERVKAVCTHITCDAADDGVAKALYALLNL